MSDKTTYILELVVLIFLGVVLLIIMTIRSLQHIHRAQNAEPLSDEERKVIKSLDGTEARLGTKIDGLGMKISGMRQHHDVNLDAVAGDTKNIRRTVEWIRMQWEKFSRPGGDGR